MARELITWCDRHADRDENVKGLTRRLDIGQGPRDVDLCDDCHTEITETIAKLLIVHGRAVDVETGYEKLHCPFCTRKLTTPARLSKHVDDIHPDQAASFITAMVGARVRRDATPLPEAAEELPHVHGPAGVHDCDQCDASFPRPQSLGVHKRLKHGVVGVSDGAVAARRAKERESA